MKEYIVVEWVNKIPKKVAKFNSLKKLMAFDKYLKPNKEGIFEGTFHNGNYWKVISEEVYKYQRGAIK